MSPLPYEPLPYAEFAEPAATLAPTFDVLPYSALPALEAEAPILGEFVAEAGEVALAGALAEPALILGAGLLAGAAAEAIFNNLNPSHPKPQLQRKPGGGRIGSGRWLVGVNYQTTGAGNVNTAFLVQGAVLGIAITGYYLGSIIWSIVTSVQNYQVLSDPPDDVQVAPNITGITPYDGQGDPTIAPAPVWVNPGTGLLPPAVPKNYTLPNGDTVPYTLQPLPNPRALPSAKPNQPYSPGIQVFAPEPGLLINFGPVNVQLTYTTGLSTTVALPAPLGGYPGTPPPPMPCPCDPVDTAKIVCLLRELESGLLNDGYDYPTYSGGSGNGGSTSGDNTNLFAAKINCTAVGEQVKTIRVDGDTPQIYILGWFSWLFQGKPGERIPINYKESAWIAPEGATGFTWGLYYGCNATATAVSKVKRSFSSAC